GGAKMRAEIDTFVANHAWARFRETLGPQLYASALRHASIMLGNSSSGLIEAGLFGLPVINVGGRPQGRESGGNVPHVPASAAAVSAALDEFCSGPARFSCETPYGDGMSGPRVAAAILGALARPDLLRKHAEPTGGA